MFPTFTPLAHPMAGLPPNMIPPVTSRKRKNNSNEEWYTDLTSGVRNQLIDFVSNTVGPTHSKNVQKKLSDFFKQAKSKDEFAQFIIDFVEQCCQNSQVDQPFVEQFVIGCLGSFPTEIPGYGGYGGYDGYGEYRTPPPVQIPPEIC